MRNTIVVLLVAFLVAALERAVAPVALVVPLVIGFSLFNSMGRGFLVAMMVGLIEDLMMVRRLGVSSVVFLVVVLILGLYRRKFSPLNWWWLLVFSLVASFSYWQVVEGGWLAGRSLVEAGLVVVWWLVRMGGQGVSEGVYLRREE